MSIPQTTLASDSERSKEHSSVKGTADLELEEAAPVSHSGPTRPAPGADVHVDVRV